MYETSMHLAPACVHLAMCVQPQDRPVAAKDLGVHAACVCGRALRFGVHFHLQGWMDARKQLGILSLLACVLHLIASAFLWGPTYYSKFYEFKVRP